MNAFEFRVAAIDHLQGRSCNEVIMNSHGDIFVGTIHFFSLWAGGGDFLNWSIWRAADGQFGRQFNVDFEL